MFHPISLLLFRTSRWMPAMPTGSDLEIVKAKDLSSFNRIYCITLRLQQLFRHVTQFINTPNSYQSKLLIVYEQYCIGSDAKHIKDWRDTCWKHRFMEELHQSILSSRSIQNSSNSMWICHCRSCQKLTRQLRCKGLNLFTLCCSLNKSVLVARASPVLPYYMLLGPSFWPRPNCGSWWHLILLSSSIQRPRPATRIGKMWSLGWCCQGGMSQFKELKAGDEAQAFCCCSSKSECFKCWPGMVGLLICTLPLRVQISQSASCIGLAVFQCFFLLFFVSCIWYSHSCVGRF